MNTNLAYLLFFAVAVLLFPPIEPAPVGDCGRYCFSGTLDFSPQLSDPVEFSVALIPCTQAVDGHINQVPVASFFCAKPSNDVLQVGFRTAEGQLPFYKLQWNYNSTSSCASVLQSQIGAIDGAFLGATHTAMLLGSDPIVVTVTSQRMEDFVQTCGQDCGARCFSFELVANQGMAGVSSPCGAEGATSCKFLLSFTLTPCTGLIANLDVLIGDNRTPMSVIDPVQLTAAQFQCLDNGQLQLQSTGTYVLWDPTSLPCEQLMDSLSGKATSGVQQFVMEFGSEQWQSTSPQGAQTSPALSLCEAVHLNDNNNASSDDQQQADEDNLPLNYWTFPSFKPVIPFVTCSHNNLPDEMCCTVFGWHNKNPHNVTIHRVEGSNYFTPKPVNRNQENFFHANTEVKEAFSIIWPCKAFREQTLTWSLNHPARGSDSEWTLADIFAGDVTSDNFDLTTERRWLRQARAIRTRNDCKASQREQWCHFEA